MYTQQLTFLEEEGNDDSEEEEDDDERNDAFERNLREKAEKKAKHDNEPVVESKVIDQFNFFVCRSTPIFKLNI